MSSVRVVPETRLMSGEQLSADDAWPTIRRYGLWPLLRDGFLRFRYGDGFSHARGFALQFALAVVPIVIAGAGLSVALGGESLGEVVARTVVAVSPGSDDALVRDAVQGTQDDDKGEFAFIVGILTAFVAATTAFAQLERGANRIYGTERDRPALHKYFRAGILTATAGSAMVVGLVLIVAGGALGDALEATYSLDDWAIHAFEILRWPAGLLALVVAVTLVFRHAPRRRQPASSWLAVGASVAVLGWLGASSLLGLYVESSGSVDATYGSLTAVIALLLWSNITGIALLSGMALAAQLEAVRAGQSDPRLPDSDDDGIPDALDPKNSSGSEERNPASGRTTERVSQVLIGPVLRYVDATSATVWVEADRPCEVEVLGHRERTWTVAGHHYALVTIEGLQPGTSTPYEVRLDGEIAWPHPDSTRPPCRIRTHDPDRPIRLVYGSCRYAKESAVIDLHFDSDSLVCFSRTLTELDEREWPDAVLMLGDQVYADEITDATQRRIRERREIVDGPKEEVADYEEYTWLYSESWTDPDVRWLLSTVSSSMIFDDHDVRDDWNISHAWRLEMQETTWWQERIVGGLSSYWVYQHLGNLAPAELAENALYQRVRSCSGDAEALLRDFATEADKEADGGPGTRWSYCRDFGRTRLVMIDSRCGRVVTDDRREIVGDHEFGWIEEQFRGDFDHLLIGTSLPWLMAPALHDLEGWNEVLGSGVRGKRMTIWAEKWRQALDLEHWAAFRTSFERLADLLASVGRGELSTGRPPATVCVLSGDVHHAYLAEAVYPDAVAAGVYQLTCSPLHNHIPYPVKVVFQISWRRVTERVIYRLLGLVAKPPNTSISWKRLSGPYFGNELGMLEIDGRKAETTLQKATPTGRQPALIEVARVTLSED